MVLTKLHALDGDLDKVLVDYPDYGERVEDSEPKTSWKAMRFADGQ